MQSAISATDIGAAVLAAIGGVLALLAGTTTALVIGVLLLAAAVFLVVRAVREQQAARREVFEAAVQASAHPGRPGEADQLPDLSSLATRDVVGEPGDWHTGSLRLGPLLIVVGLAFIVVPPVAGAWMPMAAGVGVLLLVGGAALVGTYLYASSKVRAVRRRAHSGAARPPR